MKLRFCPLVTGIALAATAALATTPRHLQPSTPRTVVVNDTEQPPVVRTGQLQVTLIVLPPEEKVATVFGGDTVNWVFDGGHVASRFISVKPKTAGSSTDLHIVSDRGNEYTIRKFNRWYTSDELIASGSLPREVRDRVVEMMGARRNGIVAGGTGSGKTTLMKSLLDHIPRSERLCIIEQPAELKIAHPNAVQWEAVEAIPGQVAVTPSELLAAALRHRPDRIIMGEIRNECAFDLLQAMNTGHCGTMSTIHAASALDALGRLSNLALSARGNINHGFIRTETAAAIDFVLYCERHTSGKRQVREMLTVSGYDQDLY